jgi:hypothetical protein
LTLAEIYAAQGHKQRAVETLKRVLEDEPDHGAARALLEKLEAAGYVAPPLPLPPEDEAARDEIGANLGSGSTATEPPETAAAVTGEASSAAVEEAEPNPTDEEPETRRMDLADLDEAPTIRRDEAFLAPEAPPETPEPPPSTAPAPTSAGPASAPGEDDGADVCVAIPLPSSVYVSWRLRAATRRRLQDEPAFFFVRAVILVPRWEGPEQQIRDLACDEAAGELLVRDLPHRSVVRIAVGVLEEGRFVPFAHSPAFEKRPDGTSTKLVRWSLDGYRPVAPDDPSRATLARALKRLGRATERAGIVTGTIELG